MTPHSPASNRKAARTKRGCAYVLWGDGFDEVLAVTFVAELRKAGLQVKLVGLRQQPMAGAYGVILVPEIGLDEALALTKEVYYLVLPCDCSVLQRLENEPRLHGLLMLIQANEAQLVLACWEAKAWTQVDLPLDAFAQVMVITPDNGDQLGSVQQLIQGIEAERGSCTW